MSLISIIWPMIAASSLTLAAVHVLVWLKDHSARANGIFAVTAIATAAIAWFELALMRTDTPEQYEVLHRWAHLASATFIIGLIGFTWTFLQAGRRWLGWTIIGLRLVILMVSFSPLGASFNWESIHRLEPILFLGEMVSMPIGVPTTWGKLGHLTILMILAFVVDAMITVLRRGSSDRERKRALVVGSGVISCVVIAGGSSILLHTMAGPITYLISVGFMAVILAMGYELSNDLVKASQLTQDLQESERRNELAARAAKLGLWCWDISGDKIVATPSARQIYGHPESGEISFGHFLSAVHPDDLPQVQLTIQRSLLGNGHFEAEYRVQAPGAEQERWVHALGQVEFNTMGEPTLMRGVSIDVTESRQSRLQLGRLQQEIAHYGRVSLMGELSASLAHELNQPLTAIMANAQAAQRFMANDEVDMDEFREILNDIVFDTTRARDVIRNVRDLVKKGDRTMILLDANELCAEVIKFLHGDIVARNVTVVPRFEEDLPQVTGDRPQVQQVLINLLLNAFDAVGENANGRRLVELITTRDAGYVLIQVADNGAGIPDHHLERLFEPFFTTKVSGMGMGLSLSRAVIEGHGGRLWAENLPEGGARVNLTLPAPPSI